MGNKQIKTDREIYVDVRSEAMAGAGMSLPVVSVFRMLEHLGDTYEERFSIDAACAALDSLVRIAEIAKRELAEGKRKAQAETP